MPNPPNESINLPAQSPDRTPSPTYTGDAKVRVWGTFTGIDSNHNSYVQQLDDHSGGTYFPEIEAALNGVPHVVFETITLPADYFYPKNPSPGDGTFVAWFAGRKGDAGDQANNFVSGLGDNMSMGLSWVIRDKLVGFNTVDYGSSAYVWGDRTGTAVGVVTGGAAIGKGLYKVATAVDELGRCANPIAKFVMGGCFVAGTKVTVSDLPYSESREQALWSETDWLEEKSEPVDWSPEQNGKTVQAILQAPVSLATRTQSPGHFKLPIEKVPLGARVPTKNPKPWEYDDSLPDPVQADWAKISITMHRNDGGIVDAELIRPRSWIHTHRIEADKLLPMNIEELQVNGSATVTAIDDCPEIADGEGRVVTAKFLTRAVNTIARVEIRGAHGQDEVLEGTTIHPIWSLDREDWVELSELQEGERLQSADGFAAVLSIALVNTHVPVYNIEVHGEHVYEVGENSLLVHNAYPIHHIATNKNWIAGSQWSAKFQKLFAKSGRSLDQGNRTLGA